MNIFKIFSLKEVCFSFYFPKGVLRTTFVFNFKIVPVFYDYNGSTVSPGITKLLQQSHAVPPTSE